MYNESDQHRSIYDSYNAELVSTKIKSIKLENASNTYSSCNSVKFDTDDAHDNFYCVINFLRGTAKVEYSAVARLCA